MSFNLKKDSEGNFPYIQGKKTHFCTSRRQKYNLEKQTYPEIQEISKITLNFRPFEGFSSFFLAESK